MNRNSNFTLLAAVAMIAASAGTTGAHLPEPPRPLPRQPPERAREQLQRAAAKRHRKALKLAAQRHGA